MMFSAVAAQNMFAAQNINRFSPSDDGVRQNPFIFFFFFFFFGKSQFFRSAGTVIEQIKKASPYARHLTTEIFSY